MKRLLSGLITVFMLLSLATGCQKTIVDPPDSSSVIEVPPAESGDSEESESPPPPLPEIPTNEYRNRPLWTDYLEQEYGDTEGNISLTKNQGGNIFDSRQELFYGKSILA